MSLRALQVCVLCVVGVPLADLVNDVKNKEAEIVEALQSRTLWEYETERDKLLGYIDTARQLRLSAAAPILAEHLAFGPTGPFELHPTTIEMKFPVCPALVAIGTPSVPHLIQRLSIVDPDDQLGTGGRQHALAVWCLVEIYGPGDKGQKLAKLRIELAAEEAEGPFKERLLRAAKYFVVDTNIEK